MVGDEKDINLRASHEMAAKPERHLSHFQLVYAVGPCSDSQLLASKFGKSVPGEATSTYSTAALPLVLGVHLRPLNHFKLTSVYHLQNLTTIPSFLVVSSTKKDEFTSEM